MGKGYSSSMGCKLISSGYPSMRYWWALLITIRIALLHILPFWTGKMASAAILLASRHRQRHHTKLHSPNRTWYLKSRERELLVLN
jgi:hypothetical protein